VSDYNGFVAEFKCISMKKIAFIVRMFQKKSFHGGGEKLFYNLIKRFCENGVTVDIYCSETDMKQAGFAGKITVINQHYDHNKPETMENFYDKVKELIKDENYDFVISENITPPVDITYLQGHSLVNRLKKVKNPVEAFLYNFRNIKKERIKYQEKWLQQGYRKIFAVSEILKQDIVENFDIPEEKISVIYPGVEIREAKNPVSKREVPTFGLLAPGFKIKGGFVFLEAMKILKQKGYDFKAKIVYPKSEKNLGVKFFVRMNNLSGNVDFLPYQKNVIDFYNSIDCLVVPSLEDTFNLAALEAMACSKPCIISNNAGASEIIEEGVNGFTFNVKKNPEKNLAEKIMFLLKNPEFYPKLSESAYKTAKKYSWDKTYEQFFNELTKIC